MPLDSKYVVGCFKLLRPWQWTKNLFVFLPLFFSGEIFTSYLLWHTVLAFISFSFASSSIYCLNDICDMDRDRQHPIKCQRPIAAGIVGIGTGYIMQGMTFLAAFAVLLILPVPIRWQIMAMIGTQYLLMLAYCLWLKKIEIVDVTVIAIGFVIRIITGSIASASYLSQWIVLMTFLLALLLALSKRRSSLVISLEKQSTTYDRRVGFVDNIIIMISAVTIVCYIMYTLAVEVQGRLNTSLLYVTSIFVILGIWRYLKVVMLDHCVLGPTRILLRDRFLQVCILLWGLTYFVLLYLL